MNHSALKSFAQDARRKLRELIGARLDYVLTADTAELRQQAEQVTELGIALQRAGREALLERVAYTWFNRLTALRFMDANGYHLFGARVIMPATANETLPEVLQQARAGVLDEQLRAQIHNQTIFDDLLAGRIPTTQPEASIYRLLLVAACNYYHTLMPFMFEKIGDATELLLPEDLLTEHSIVHLFRTELADDDCHDVEVIGWLYQYFISEKKAAVMARNAVVPKEDIPAVTQIFTPHWIVRYLVENSLGRLWLLNRPHSRLRERMPYYVEAEPETEYLQIAKPEEIRLLDDACGSGHMLTYAYDLLYAIYLEEGYDAPDIPSLILKHNLYGVEICDRAAALAAFALCMKARSSDSRFFRRVVQPNIISLQDVRFDEGDLSAYFKAIGSQPSAINHQLAGLLYQFQDAKNLGSLIQPCLSEPEIQGVREEIENRASRLKTRDLRIALTHNGVLRVLDQAKYLSQRCHVVVANPPYMGSSAMNESLSEFVSATLAEGKADMYAAFMLRNLKLVMQQGKVGMITIPNWMFLSSFERLRDMLLRIAPVSSLIHCGRGIWGSDFGSCAFVLSTSPTPTQRGEFRRLFQKPGEVQSVQEIEANFLDRRSYPPFHVAVGDFRKITGFPFAYWVGRYDIFDLPLLGSRVVSGGRIKTHDGPRFIRFHWEISRRSKRWRLFLKGGEFRRFYGNENYVVDWSDGALTSYNRHGGLTRLEFRSREGICWSKITVALSSFRLKRMESEYDSASPTIFTKDFRCDEQMLGYLNSRVATHVLGALNPTVNTQVADVLALPFTELIGNSKELVINHTQEAIALARSDWDNSETSWAFRDLPLLRAGLKGATLEASWQHWKTQCDVAIHRMQTLETENNRVFITVYGLQAQLSPEVPEDQITLARADARKDIAAFVSYAVGCMMGRFSLDAPGLMLADASSTTTDYHCMVAEHRASSPCPPVAAPQSPSFPPDADGILPVLDGEWFADDIVGRFREFLRVTFGAETLAENLAFIEASLGKVDARTGKSRPTDLRTYFVGDFYKNHLSGERAFGYKKRPIYWMFSSPEGSFQALIYLHRYTRDTVNLLLNDYVREFTHKLEERQRQLMGVTSNASARSGDRTKAVKELGKIDKMLKEVRAWERDVLLPLAQQRIELDLDDGVKLNYLKFKGAVVPIPGLEKQEED